MIKKAVYKSFGTDEKYTILFQLPNEDTTSFTGRKTEALYCLDELKQQAKANGYLTVNNTGTRA